MPTSNKFQVMGKSVMQKRYSDPQLANNYITERFSDPLWIYVHQQEVGFVNQIIKKNKPHHILDLATGPARIAADIITDQIESAYAIDSSDAMLNIARNCLNKKWTIEKQDAFKLKINSNSFELVFSFRFIRHFDYSDRRKIITEISKTLIPKGILIFDVLNKNMLRGQYIEQFTGAWDKSIYDEVYTEPEIIEEMRRFGYSPFLIQPLLNDWPSLVGLQSQLTNQGLSKEKIVQRLLISDQKISKHNFSWISAWIKNES